MASNPLLALLNFNPRSTPSPSHEAPPAASSPPTSTTPTATAGSLLQSILSPPSRESFRPALAEQTASSPSIASPPKSARVGPAQSPSPLPAQPPTNAASAPKTANDLLALLSGSSNRSVAREDRQDNGSHDASFHESSPRPWQQPIGTPPSQSTRSEQSKSPLPTTFDAVNLFDMLRQPNESDRRSAAKEKDFAKIPAPERIESAPTPVPSLELAYTIDRKQHASYHLGGLHASAGFEDDISSGFSLEALSDGTQQFSLDLAAPQPAGPSSIYPAKLEITAISLLTTAFAPSCHVNTETGLSRVARWPCQRVSGMCGKIVMYVMSKGRIRVIDQDSGDRVLARADSPIRSVFAGEYKSKADSKHLFAATTEKGGLYVWQLDEGFGKSEQDAPIVGQLSAEEGKTFVHACWRPNSQNTELIVVQSDGQVALLQVEELRRQAKQNDGRLTWALSAKKVLKQSVTAEQCLVGVSVSTDGSLLAVVDAHQSSDSEITPRLTLSSLTHPNRQPHAVALPRLSQTGVSNVSFVSFADDKNDQLPRSLILGFDDNQVIALVDLATGSYSQIYRFNSRSGASFSLAAWHSTSSSLILCCSIRSSIFSLRPQFAKAAPSTGQEDQSCQVLDRLKRNSLPLRVLALKPALRECALPEPYTSFAVDDTNEDDGALRILGSHLGGIHSLMLPQEALVQTAIEESAQEQEQKAQAGPGGAELESATAHKAPSQLAKPSQLANSSPSQAEPKPKQAAKAAQEADRRTQTNPLLASVTIESRGNGAAGKQTEGRKKASHNLNTAKSAKASKGVDEDVATNSASAEGGAGLDGGEIKALLEKCENSIVERLRSEVQPGQGASNGREPVQASEVAQLLSDKLVPVMSATINEAVRNEVQQAFATALSHHLPNELHKMLLRPDINSHLTRSITNSILPPIQKTAMDVVSRALGPHLEGVMSNSTTRIEAKMESAVTGIRKDIVTEQSKALLETEDEMRNLTRQMATLSRTVQDLAEQNRRLELTLEEMRKEQKPSGRAVSKGSTHDAASAQTILYPGFPDQQATPSLATPLNQFSAYQPGPGQAAKPRTEYMQSPLPPQQSETAPALSTQTNQQPMRDVGLINQELEDALLQALSSPNVDVDPTSLRSTLTAIESKWGSPMAALWGSQGRAPSLQSNMPGKPAISQAVILTLLHRLIKTLGRQSEEGNANAEMDVPWIETCASALDRNDETIARFVEGTKRDMVDSLIRAHHTLKRRNLATWWTDDRLGFGVLRFLQ